MIHPTTYIIENIVGKEGKPAHAGFSKTLGIHEDTFRRAKNWGYAPEEEKEGNPQVLAFCKSKPSCEGKPALVQYCKTLGISKRVEGEGDKPSPYP